MNPSTKKTLIIVIIVLLVLCLCAAAVVLLGGIALFKNNLAPTIAAKFTPEQPISTATALPQASPESSEDAISASMDEIERQVSAIRGLKLDNAIPRKLLTEEIGRAHV